MKNKKILILYLLTIINSRVYCDDIITFFFKPYPAKHTDVKNAQNALQQDAQIIKKIDKFADPEKISKYTIRGITNDPKNPNNYLTTGIFCSYEGFLTSSDLNGQVVFPKKQQEPKVTLVISKYLTPIIMIENTVHHWKISNPNFAKMYEFERLTDKTTKQSLWKTKEIAIPEDRIVPEYSIIIIANPKHIYIPTGMSLTAKDPQLILPNIYVKQGINKINHSLYMFGIKNFMAPNKYVYKKDKMGYQYQLKDTN